MEELGVSSSFNSVLHFFSYNTVMSETNSQIPESPISEKL